MRLRGGLRIRKPFEPRAKRSPAIFSQTISAIELFEDVSQEDMEHLVNAMEARPAHEGEFVIRQDEPGVYFYVVHTGEYDVLLNQAGPNPVFTYQSGGFGELALLYDKPRAASIRCKSSGILFQLDRDTFMDIVT
jgi:cAMP-dependent protein kinase regulator